MSQQSLQLLSRFSYSPNALHYCGRPSANQAFLNCIKQGKCSAVKEEAKHFIVLWPYLKTIADIAGQDPFSPEVIEAYWLGNKLLDKIKLEHYQVLLKHFKTQGVPDFLIKEIKQNPPSKFIPIHLFNILHVGVGRASGSVLFNLESINHCMIRWGKIIKLNKKKHLATIKLNSLVQKNDPELPTTNYKLRIQTETHPYHPSWFTNLQAGQTACVHWQLLCHTPTPQQETHLSHHTTKLINNL